MSDISVPVPGLSTFPFMSAMPVSEPELSPPLFPICSSPQTLIPVPVRQKLGQWGGILKSASVKEAPTTLALLFPPSECSSPLFFLSSSIGEKRPFYKVFNIDCWPLADDYIGKDVGKKKFDKNFINTWLLVNNHAKKEVDLSFAECKSSPAVKLNRSC